MDRDVWNSHKWSSARGRQIEIEPGKPLIQHRCSRCRRDYVEDASTGERYAVYVSVFSFRRLPDPVSRRWLAELCPGAPLPFDIEVRRKLIEDRVKWPPPSRMSGTAGLSAPLSSSGADTIAKKKSRTITVTDAPTTGRSTLTQTLKILSDDPSRPEVDISVTGNSP